MRAKLKLQGPLTASRLVLWVFAIVSLGFKFKQQNSKTAQFLEKLSWPSCSRMCRSVPKTCAFVLRLALWGIQIRCCVTTQFESFLQISSSTSESNASYGGATTSSCHERSLFCKQIWSSETFLSLAHCFRRCKLSPVLNVLVSS